MKIARKLFIISFFISISQVTFAITYFSKTSGGNWNDNTTWSTTGYGQATNSGTYPKSGDNALIGDGYSVIVNLTQQVGSITIGQGASGVVEYSSAAAYTLTVINALTINAGAKLWYNGNTTRTHTLQVGTNLSNAGTIDLYSDADDVVNLIFYRSANSTVSGSGTFDLNSVTLNKSTSISYSVDITSTTFESAIRDLTITYGVFNHNNSSSFSVNSGATFTIGADATLKVTAGTVNLASSNDEVTLNGRIQVVGGSLNIGSSAGNTGLRYDKTTSYIPRIELEGGNMTVFGGINYKAGASADPIYFSISSGTILLNSGSNGTSQTPFNINDVTGSTFIMTDGNIILQNPNTTSSSVSDFILCVNNGTVTSAGGTIQFGNSSTPNGANFTFEPKSNITFPNIKVSGSSSNAVSLKPSVSSTENLKCISLYVDELALFDARAVSGSTGDDRTIELTGSMDGINAIYLVGSCNFRTSTLILSGVDAQQLSGTGVYNIASLEVNNSSGITLDDDVHISGQLTLTNGIVHSNSNAKFILNESSINDAGSNSSFIDGPFSFSISSAGTTSLVFPVGKDGSYRPVTLNVQHSTASTAEYQLQVLNNSARNFNYTLPVGLDKVSNRRYFQIDRTGASNLTNANIILSYDSDDDVSDYANLRVVQDDGASSWLDLAGTASGNTNGTITSSSFSNFGSKFTFGNATGGSNALPVALIDFSAANNNGNTKLKWVTLSEKDCSHFEVECKKNNSDFVKIGEVNAMHNSSNKLEYTFNTNQLTDFTCYYRIKIVDYDGTFAYSKICALTVNMGIELVMFPNPIVNNDVNLKLEKSEEDYNLTILNLSGNIIQEQIVNSTSKIAKINLINGLDKGLYIFKLVSTSGQEWQTTAIVTGD